MQVTEVKKKDPRAEEMAQWGRELSANARVHSNPQRLNRGPAWLCMPIRPALEGRDSSAKAESVRCSERPCLQI